MKSPLIVLALLLAGCIAGPAPEPAGMGYTIEELATHFNETKQVAFDLNDFDGDSLLVQLVPAPGQTLQVHAEGRLPMAEGTGAAGQDVDSGNPRPCLSYFSSTFRTVSFSGARQPVVIAEAAGQRADVRFPSYDVDYLPMFEHEVTAYADGHPVPLALAVADSAAWKATGELHLTVTGQQPFHWRIVPGGTLDCTPLAIDQDGGVGVDAGLATVIRDKEHRFTADGQTMSTLYVGGTGEYLVTLEGPNALYEEFTGPAAYSYGSGMFEPGDHRVHIDHMAVAQDPLGWATFPAGVFVMHHHLPAWVLLPPWDVPSLDA